jgi:uncharacterized protein (DUF4415 family)
MRKKLMKTFEPGHGFTKEDWDAVDSPELTDEELAEMRPAKEVLPKEFYESFVKHYRGPQKAPKKVAISIRLSADVIEKYRATGRGWQGRIDEDLRKALKRKKAA